jgi:beta-N-acetylhexosaminidase
VFGVIGLALLAIVGIWALFLRGGGDGGGGEEGTPLKELVGQTIIAPVGDDGVDQKLLKQVRKGRVGGIFIGGEDPLESEVQSHAARVQKAARQAGRPPMLVMVDQEGGFVKLLPGPPDLSPEEIADEGPETAQEEGSKTGEYLRGLGINVNLAPVLDVAHDNTEETIVSRTYAGDPAEVGELGSAFITGLQSQRVAATAKHFPGLGLATNNTDFDQVQIQSTSEEYQADLEPFRQAIAAGVDMIMVGTALYEVSGQNPAAFSANVVTNELRTKLGFQGVVITDDLEAPGANETPGAAALRAIRAGCDLALFAQTQGASVSAFEALTKAVKDGRLDESTLQTAYDRIQALKQKLG